MTIPFTPFFLRLLQETDIISQMDMARALEVNRSAITQAKRRDAVPDKWVLALSRRYGISPDWLQYGTPPVRSRLPKEREEKILAVAKEALLRSSEQQVNPALIYVPKVRAQLCAGGGSFSVEAVPVSQHPLPMDWLSRMGNPNSMVFMDVIGNSMEPGIADGDMVLVDQSRTELATGKVMAVGYEDSIYIKRLEKRSNTLTLLSDNPDYSPIEIQGDEIQSFRVLGKVIWLCRDL